MERYTEAMVMRGTLNITLTEATIAGVWGCYGKLWKKTGDA